MNGEQSKDINCHYRMLPASADSATDVAGPGKLKIPRRGGN